MTMTIRKQANQAKRDIAAATALFGNPSRSDVVRELKLAGYKTLGRGCFAVALAHPDHPDVVVKVGQRRIGRGRRQELSDRFPEYVEFLKDSGTRSKFALKVYHMEWLSGCGGGTYAAVVERCKAGKGSAAHKAVTASGSVVKGYRWCSKDASGHATRFIRRFAWMGKLDLHSGNVMLRPNGQAVITDPLC
ncbi:hypothetical protein [Rhizobium leguminosarum]|uniref:hypothetical protein n=1 Tax=Rhizobium leguminosarum TaxID=384 RepID=UPI001C94A8C3|nr:hypothetical protein [Rhizobium leguminosarum]MBY5581872.1 hypothetical protein [Rhizobium leguminosarum]